MRLILVLLLGVLASGAQAVDLLSLLAGDDSKSKGREKPAEKVVEKPVEKPVATPVGKVERVEVPVTNTVEKVVEKVVEKIVVVERTNVVEKVIADKAKENRLLAREQELLRRQQELLDEKSRLETENQELKDANKVLASQLSQERDQRQRLERVIPKENRQFSDKTVKIDAPSAYYDKKEGFVAFRGGVSFEDGEYQLHSDRVFVFTDASNSVRRVVALENVAVTNGPKRAYGIKASYYKQTGMVVLYGNADTPAIVRDESRVDDQEIVGEKIKFWVNSKQIEVLKAHIKAPVKGNDDLKKGILGQ